MSDIRDSIDYEIAKIWISQQDLSSVSPETAKELFFEALYKIKVKNVERWD